MAHPQSQVPQGDNPREFLETIYRTRIFLVRSNSRIILGYALFFGSLISLYFLFWHFLNPLPYISLGLLFPPMVTLFIGFILVEQKRRSYDEYQIARYLDERFRTRDLFFTALENNHRVLENDCNRQLIAAANHLSKKILPIVLNEPGSNGFYWSGALGYLVLALSMILFFLLNAPPPSDWVSQNQQTKNGEVPPKEKDKEKEGGKDGGKQSNHNQCKKDQPCKGEKGDGKT